MTESEEKEIQELPEKYRPLSTWNYVLSEILCILPIIGLIYTFVESNSSENYQQRELAKSWVFDSIIITVLVFTLLCS